MKKIGLLVAALLIIGSQARAATPKLHLVYEFGYNTKVASSGNGTGTTTIDVAPAADGGLMISGTDHWWNTARPRATNTCEVHPNGNVSCLQPYAISPIQLTIFPLLAKGYFAGVLTAGSTATRSYEVKAAILPGASGMAGQLTTWNCSYTLNGKGPISKGGGLVLVETNGTLNQQGGHYLIAKSKQRIAYDSVRHVPAVVSDVRTHIPQRTVYNNDLVELKLTKYSGG